MSTEVRYRNKLSLELHRAIAAKLRADPRLLDRVRKNVRVHRARVEGGHANERVYTERWEHLVARGLDAVLEAALAEGDEAETLRSVSPFAGILTEAERAAVASQVTRKYEAV
jgi:hypothetical protein